MRRVLSFVLAIGMCLGGYAQDAGSEEPDVMDNDFLFALESMGGVTNDVSDSQKIKLDEPSYAYVNFSGFEKMPETKQSDYKGWLEFFDGKGNYFKKRVIVNAQGGSSLVWAKKNIGIDICEDEWEGDETTDVTFGKWVKQDSFHLKAYYTDYFRGLAVVAYKVFDDIIADHGSMAHPWQRAGVDDADKKARCHPDGFPVGVYLNGEFYGVFSWQLKKHRKNMGMTKDCAEHIHLDGILADSFFKGEIDWTQFEIRNPKTLYSMDGSKYNGDKPLEIIDESSEFFDASNKGHVLSAKVKKYIQTLTTRVPKLLEYRQGGKSSEEIRAELERYFDVQGLIDYTVFSSVVNNIDGWKKNWQWITYDGEKWYVEPYDLDMTFGNTYYGYATTPPEVNWFDEKPGNRFAIDNGPSTYINLYYTKDLEKRYAELRNSRAIDSEAIISKVRDWYNRVGEDNYALEYEKWPDSYCVQEPVIDDNWSLADDFSQYPLLKDWDKDTTYHEGDMCRAYYQVWIAKNDVTGIHPCPHPGYHDSLDRVEDWIVRRIAMEDSLWNYDPLGVESTLIGNEGNREIEAIFNVNGQRLQKLQKGVNIVKYTGGATAKVMVR